MLWYRALRQVLPVYIASHFAFVLLTYFAVLFRLNDFSGNRLSTSILLRSWWRWDSGHFATIATTGYNGAWRTAFSPCIRCSNI